MTFIDQLPCPKMLIVHLLAPAQAFCRPCPVSSGKSFLTLCLFSYGSGEGAKLQKRPREGLGLASGPCLPPRPSALIRNQGGSSFPGIGGWASCSSPLRKSRWSGNAFVTAHGQHKGGCRRSFLSRRKGEGQWPTSGPARSSQMLGKDVLATSSLLGGVFPSHGQILWRTLVCRAGHTLTGTQYPPQHTHTYTHIHSPGTVG